MIRERLPEPVRVLLLEAQKTLQTTAQQAAVRVVRPLASRLGMPAAQEVAQLRGEVVRLQKLVEKLDQRLALTRGLLSRDEPTSDRQEP